jgi:hypothetical protein
MLESPRVEVHILHRAQWCSGRVIFATRRTSNKAERFHSWYHHVRCSYRFVQDTHNYCALTAAIIPAGSLRPYITVGSHLPADALYYLSLMHDNVFIVQRDYND